MCAHGGGVTAAAQAASLCSRRNNAVIIITNNDVIADVIIIANNDAITDVIIIATGALRVAGRLEQELREGGAVRVDAEGRRECEKGGHGAQGRQEAADASQSGDDLDRSVLEPWGEKPQE